MKSDLERLAHTLLPGIEPYVVSASDGVSESIHLPGAFAQTGRTLDLLLQPMLSARGAWRGRHPAILVFDDTIRQAIAAGADADDDHEALFEQILAGCIVHEAAHIAESEPDLSAPTAERLEFAEAIAAYSLVVDADTTRPPMTGHSWRFVRLAIHLHHRAKRAGFIVPRRFLFSGETYAIAEPRDFAYVLGGELENLEAESIFEINRFRPPLGFVRLWQQCVQHWADQLPSSLENTAAVSRLLNCEPIGATNNDQHA